MTPAICRRPLESRARSAMAAAAFLLLGSLLLLPLTAHGEAAPSTPAAVPPATGGAPTPSPVGNVDYRYPFTLEAAATVGFFGTFGTYSTSLFAYGGSLTFGGPVSEGRQIIGGVAAATGQAGPSYAWLVEAFAGYRILTFADPWRTRFDAALALDYSRFNTPVIGTAVHAGVGLGVRAAVAVQYFFTPSLGIGPQVDVQVLAITFEAFASLGAVVTFDW